MKIHSRKRILFFALYSLLAGLALSAARIVISMSALESGIEMYAHGSVSALILHLSMAVCTGIAMTGGILVILHDRKAREDFPSQTVFFPSPLNVFASTLCGFMLLAFSLLTLYYLYAGRWSALAPLFGQQTHASGAVSTALFTLLQIILAVPAAVYFLKAAAGTPKKPAVFGTLSVLPAIWLILILLSGYFDAAVAFNSPVKIVRLLSLAAMMLYAVQESRMVLGIPMPRLYFAFGYASVLFGTAQVISDLVLYASGRIVVPNGYLGLAIEFSYIFYILTRILGFGSQKVSDQKQNA